MLHEFPAKVSHSSSFEFKPLAHVLQGYDSHSVCLLPKLAATYMYLVCESKVRCYKVPYGVTNAPIVWMPKTLCLPVLASFADSKLRILYVQIVHCVSCMRYIQYVSINPWRMRFRHSCKSLTMVQCSPKQNSRHDKRAWYGWSLEPVATSKLLGYPIPT